MLDVRELLVCGYSWSEAGRQRCSNGIAICHVESFEECFNVVFLGYDESSPGTISYNVEPKEVVDRSVVGTFKACIEALLECVQFLPRVRGNQLIVDVDGDHDSMVVLPSYVQARISTCGSEAVFAHPFVECLVEAAWGLAKAIEGFA